MTFNLITIKKIVPFILCLLFTISSVAAPPPSWDEYEESGVNDQDAPTGNIDNFLYLALASGAIYGIQVLKKRRVQEQLP